MIRQMAIIAILLSARMSAFGQDTLFNLRSPLQTIPLNTGYESMDVDNEGNILLIDTDKSQVVKILQTTAYDSSIVIGGKSHRNEGFLHPVKISVKNRQNLYLLDDVSRKILLLNTNFKVAGEINFLTPPPDVNGSFGGESDIYPVSFDVSMDGTLFVLNQFDNKVYVFYPSGKFQLSFGGLDYGSGALLHPVDIQVNEKNYVFVSDTATGQILIFDNFGVFRTKRKPQTAFAWKNFHLSGNSLICFDSGHIYLENLVTGKNHSLTLPPDQTLTDLKLKGEYLYLLQKNAINLYRPGE
ncbi:MAG: 6-bladed beta-propeller [Bacteroidia bacterium]